MVNLETNNILTLRVCTSQRVKPNVLPWIDVVTIADRHVAVANAPRSRGPVAAVNWARSPIATSSVIFKRPKLLADPCLLVMPAAHSFAHNAPLALRSAANFNHV